MTGKVGIQCPRCDKRFLSPLTAVSHLLADHPHKVGWQQPRNIKEVKDGS